MADLRTLQPGLVPWARWIYAVGKNESGKLVVTSALRSSAKQAKLRAAWERGQSKIPANRPGTSLHEFGLAFDMAQMGVDPFEDPILPWLGYWWEYYGGKYGGPGDPVHFQIRV